MDELDGLPIRDIPPGVMGQTKRHRKLNILVSCGTQTHRIGWLIFGGKDASFYIHQSGAATIVRVGTALPVNGNLVPVHGQDITNIPLAHRSGTHISLHPSGEVHLKSSTGNMLTAANIGPWLPVERRFTFAYWFTSPLGTLPVVPSGTPRGFPVNDPSKSLRLEIVICPALKMGDRVGVPFCSNTLFVGGSSHYWVLLNGDIVPACESYFFFLASPAYQTDIDATGGHKR